MNKNEINTWLGWTGFIACIVGFATLEEYAVRTGKIRPFSDLMWGIQSTPKHPLKREALRYTLMGAFVGWSGWQMKHFFFEGKHKV